MIDWLLNGEPREAQLEALRRSYRGVATRDRIDDEPFVRAVPKSNGEPAKGWGHLLEMRVGKTPTYLNEFGLFRRDFGIKWNIIFSPNAFKEDWPIEAEKFGLDAPAFALDTSSLKKTQAWVDKHQRTGGLLSVNYEAMRSAPVMALLASLVGRETMIGADESVKIKTHNSGFTKNALELAKSCAVRRILSGKPVVQGPHDLWSQLRFIGELDGFMYHPFKSAFCKMGGFQGKQIIGVKDPERLNAILDRCSWNGRKTDWLKTPGVFYGERQVALRPDQLARYRQMQEDFLTELEDGTTVASDQIVTKLLKMQQIASGFIIDEDGTTHDLMPVEQNPKLNAIRDILAEEAITKIIVITNFHRSLDLLEQALAPWNPAVIRGAAWHGKNDRPIVNEKDRFNNDPRCRVLIGQSQAIKYGHTLMGSNEGENNRCYTVIMHENSYSLDDRSQGEERPQGVGQLQPIDVIDFICTEEDYKPIRALQRKEDMSAAILGYDRSTGLLPHTPSCPGRGIGRASEGSPAIYIAQPHTDAPRAPPTAHGELRSGRRPLAFAGPFRGRSLRGGIFIQLLRGRRLGVNVGEGDRAGLADAQADVLDDNQQVLIVVIGGDANIQPLGQFRTGLGHAASHLFPVGSHGFEGGFAPEFLLERLGNSRVHASSDIHGSFPPHRARQTALCSFT